MSCIVHSISLIYMTTLLVSNWLNFNRTDFNVTKKREIFLFAYATNILTISTICGADVTFKPHIIYFCFDSKGTTFEVPLVSLKFCFLHLESQVESHLKISGSVTWSLNILLVSKIINQIDYYNNFMNAGFICIQNNIRENFIIQFFCNKSLTGKEREWIIVEFFLLHLCSLSKTDCN